MIFVTVGTHHEPFQRLLDALDTLEPADLVVQYGTGAPPACATRAMAFLPLDQIVSCFRAADTVITHAGVGSIICASREGHVPIVVPRRHDLGEHVDEHQAELSRELESRGSVVAVWDVGRLGETIATVPPRRSGSEQKEPELCTPVRAALLGVDVSR